MKTFRTHLHQQKKTQRVIYSLLLSLLFLFKGMAQNQLELANGSYPAAPNGLTTANQTANLLDNTTGIAFATYVPNISVTASLSNQQFNSIPATNISTSKGMNFGGRVNSLANTANQVPVFNTMNAVDNPANTSYTSNPNGPISTGIDVSANSAFYFYNSVYPLFNNSSSITGRFYYGDLTLTFSSPVSNPVIQIVGLGANVNFGGGNVQGFTSELELQTNGVALTKLSGTNELDVTANKILNNATLLSFNCGSGAACGSVKVAGTNITTLVFKIYVRGDGSGTNWSHTAINAGDEFMIGVSINKPDTISGNVFNDVNGLTDNTVNGAGTNVGGSLYANLVDANNKVVASTPIAANGSYLFANIGDGNYTVVLSTIQGTQGNTAPTASLPSGWVNTGEHIGTNSGSDGTIDGIINVTVAASNITNANFGIYSCPTITNPSANQFVCVGSNGNNITVNTSSNTNNGIRFVKFATKQIAGVMPTAVELEAIYNGNAIATTTATGASNPYTATYSWNSVDFPNATNAPITYYVYAIVNPDPGTTCRPVQEIAITINPLPVVPAISGAATVCVNATDTLSNTVTGGVWASSNNSIATVNNNGIVTGVSAGNVIITYTATNANGCVNTVSKLITSVSPAVVPTITASGATTACLGAGLTLSSSTSASYQWYKNGVIINGATSQTFVPSTSGTYTMIVVAGGGACNSVSNSIAVTINYAATPSISPSDTAIICVANHDKICPTIWGYSNYQWYKEGVLIAAPNGTSSCLYPTTAGNYTLTAQDGSGCWSLPSASVYVVIDTICSGTVTGGGGGGLESKSLGDIISKRLYGNAFNSVATINGYSNATQFVQNSGTVVNGNNGLALKDLVPATTSITNNQFITTPTDLTNITNAIDVIGIDYTNNNNTLAVAFGTKTLGEVYSHTKPICDRMKEAQLISVKKMKIDGYDVIASILKQRTGEVEHCINFSIGAKAGRNSYSLQSNWITDNYFKEDTMYNFQLWAINYNTVESMAKDIFSKVKAVKTLQALANNANDLPQVFVQTITREKTSISMVINNPTNATTCNFKMLSNLNENATDKTTNISVALKPNALNTISIPVADAYQNNLFLYINNSLNDLVYMSDGAWNINYDNATTINKFDITNAGYTTNANEYPLFRKVKVEANSRDYITAYKLMKGNGFERNFNDYKAVKFTASAVGTTKLKITLVKKSITNWNDQYQYTLAITGNEVEYAVGLAQFVSKANSSAIDLSDITAIDFTWENNAGGVRNIGGTINNLRFSKESAANIVTTTNEIVIYPNPNKGKFVANFMADADESMVLKLVEAGSGKLVHIQFINAKKGMNKVNVALENNAMNSGLFILTLEADETKYKPTKVMISKP